jgi:hypothetical protein
VIIRFAALFSDWCEYPPLYFFLETWLSDRWNARALGGRGATSLPFLHVDDAVPFVLRVLERRHRLDPAEVVIASVDGAVTHRQLFDVSTEYAFRSWRRPWHVPKPLAFAGTWARDLVGRVTGNRPFERPWMARFIDTEMVVDASRTRERLDWAPRERLEILRRIRFMIENARTSRMEWRGRNLDALEHHELRPRFRVYRLVRKLEAEVERRFGERLDALGEAAGDRAVRERTRQTALRALVHSVRTGEKSPFTSYCQALAERQLERGAPLEVVVATVRALEASCLEVLGQDPDAADLGDVLRDAFELTAEFGIDRIHEVYESASGMATPGG